MLAKQIKIINNHIAGVNKEFKLFKTKTNIDEILDLFNKDEVYIEPSINIEIESIPIVKKR